ncbi:MAG: hypothetical protein IPI88_15570 [Chitinophagaceae bacterium]|nr:hypothetical protein [Chitinophagaceae bacterium]
MENYFISGGLFIGNSSNGEKIKLKEGKSLGVQFPKLSDGNGFILWTKK